MKRLITIAYGALLWLFAAVALGEAPPSASEQGVKPGQKYLAKPMGDLGAGPPVDCAPEKWAVLEPPGSGEQPSNPDAAEAWDFAVLHTGNLLHGPLLFLASGPEDYPACFRPSAPTGTHARAPPAITDQA